MTSVRPSLKWADEQATDLVHEDANEYQLIWEGGDLGVALTTNPSGSGVSVSRITGKGFPTGIQNVIPGDVLLAVNELNTVRLTLEDVVKYLQECDLPATLCLTRADSLANNPAFHAASSKKNQRKKKPQRQMYTPPTQMNSAEMMTSPTNAGRPSDTRLSAFNGVTESSHPSKKKSNYYRSSLAGARPTIVEQPPRLSQLQLDIPPDASALEENDDDKNAPSPLLKLTLKKTLPHQKEEHHETKSQPPHPTLPKDHSSMTSDRIIQNNDTPAMHKTTVAEPMSRPHDENDENENDEDDTRDKKKAAAVQNASSSQDTPQKQPERPQLSPKSTSREAASFNDDDDDLSQMAVMEPPVNDIEHDNVPILNHEDASRRGNDSFVQLVDEDTEHAIVVNDLGQARSPRQEAEEEEEEEDDDDEDDDDEEDDEQANGSGGQNEASGGDYVVTPPKQIVEMSMKKNKIQHQDLPPPTAPAAVPVQPYMPSPAPVVNMSLIHDAASKGNLRLVLTLMRQDKAVRI